MYERPPQGTTGEISLMSSALRGPGYQQCMLLVSPPAPPHTPIHRWSLSLSKLEKRSLFLEQSSAGQYTNSDEEDGYASPEVKRRGTSVDDFLKGSELGKQVRVCTPALALGWPWL